jgi:electron transfer flavoprotein beta subunit
VRIVVLTKPVPDPAAAAERLGPEGWLDRASAPAVVNGNDEYVLEAALKLADAAAAAGSEPVETVLLSMAPEGGAETMRKALAMGATRGLHVTDPALRGADTLATTRVLAAALRTLEFDLVFGGVDTSDGIGGVVPAGIAALLGLPLLSYAARIEPDVAARTVRIRRLSPAGYDLLEAPMPAVVTGTQLLGEPRYPSLKGIMAARSKEIVRIGLAELAGPLTELGFDAAAVSGEARTSDVVGSRPPAPRPPTRIVRGSADEGAAAIVDLLVERRLVR